MCLPLSERTASRTARSSAPRLFQKRTTSVLPSATLASSGADGSPAAMRPFRSLLAAEAGVADLAAVAGLAVAPGLGGAAGGDTVPPVADWIRALAASDFAEASCAFWTADERPFTPGA